MKKIISTMALSLIVCTCLAQVTYYKGEWTVKDKSDLFTCVCRIEIQNDGIVKGELIWTYISIDSSNAELAEAYKGKEGKSGIEYVEGIYKAATKDIYLETTKLTDSWKILGSTKYLIKLSANQQVLYGITTTLNDDAPGLFYAVKMQLSGEKDFHSLKTKIISE
jgi:hypothetical protein